MIPYLRASVPGAHGFTAAGQAADRPGRTCPFAGCARSAGNARWPGNGRAARACTGGSASLDSLEGLDGTAVMIESIAGLPDRLLRVVLGVRPRDGLGWPG